MSRSNYTHECEQWELIRYRGAVNAAMSGKRGQKLLKDIAAAMDEMENKILISDALVRDGCFCALGTAAKCRRVDLSALDPEDADSVAQAFDVAPALAREIAFENDEGGPWSREEEPEKRFIRMRQWIESNIIR